MFSLANPSIQLSAWLAFSFAFICLPVYIQQFGIFFSLHIQAIYNDNDECGLAPLPGDDTWKEYDNCIYLGL